MRERRRHGRLATVPAVAACLLVAAVACSSGGDPAGGVPAGGDERVLARGDEARAGDASATVLSVEDPVEPVVASFAAEHRYVGAEVRVCGRAADRAAPWTARTEDGLHDAVPLPRDALGDAHPILDQLDGPDGTDACLEGWVVWDLPEEPALARWDADPSVGWTLAEG